MRMGFSSSPSQSLILNSGEEIVTVKIVSFSSENRILASSFVQIWNLITVLICPLSSR